MFYTFSVYNIISYNIYNNNMYHTCYVSKYLFKTMTNEYRLLFNDMFRP